MSYDPYNVKQYEILVEHLRDQIAELQAENERLLAELEKRPEPVKSTRAQSRWRTYGGFGEEHTNAEWARRLNVPRHVLWRRLQAGTTVEEYAAMRDIKYP